LLWGQRKGYVVPHGCVALLEPLACPLVRWSVHLQLLALRGQEPERKTMARRKSADLHCRADPDNKALWQACADELGVSLSMWIEIILNDAVLKRRRARLLNVMYPNRRDRHEEYV
jgi:hypothetical protein